MGMNDELISDCKDCSEYDNCNLRCTNKVKRFRLDIFDKLTSDCKKCSRYSSCDLECKGRIRKSKCSMNLIGRYVTESGTIIFDTSMWVSGYKMRKKC